MKHILLNSSKIPVENIEVNILTVMQFVGFVAIVVGIYFTLKNKTATNSQSIMTLEKQLLEKIEENRVKITEVKDDHNKAFEKIDVEISGIKKDINLVVLSIGNIEGYMKAMSEKKK